MTQTQAKLKSITLLAFVGDAVYELFVREHISIDSDGSANALHRKAISYVCADAQAAAFEHILPHLTHDEADVARRGKNAHKTTIPRNVSPKSYRSATALETVFGYLQLCGNVQRARELFLMIAQFHEENAQAFID
ncbi:MAG: ribonuclease III domain-containing protein [Oscillospiraceae bacterium]